MTFRITFCLALAAVVFIVRDADQADVAGNLLSLAGVAAIFGILFLCDRLGRTGIAATLQYLIGFATVLVAGLVVKAHSNSDTLAVYCLGMIMFHVTHFGSKRVVPAELAEPADRTADEAQRSQS